MKKKESKASFERARDVGARVRPLAPVLRGALPVGAAAISALALMKAASPSPGPPPCAADCDANQSIFEQGMRSVEHALSRVFGVVSPTVETRQVAGAMAQLDPVPTHDPVGTTTTPVVDVQDDRPTTPPIPPHAHPPSVAGGIGAIAPPTATASTKAVAPHPHPPLLGGKPVAPSHGK